MSGAAHAKGHQAGKGGKESGRGRQWPHPKRSFRQSPPGSPSLVSAAVKAEEEREVCRQQAARYEALAHVERQRCRRQPPEQGPDTMGAWEDRIGAPGGAGGVGRGAQRAAQWWHAEGGRAGGTEQRSGGGAPRQAGERA